MFSAFTTLIGKFTGRQAQAQEEVLTISAIPTDVSISLELYRVFSFINRYATRKSCGLLVSSYFTHLGRIISPDASVMEIEEIGHDFMLSSRAVLYCATLHRSKSDILVVEIKHIAKNQVVSRFHLKTAIIDGREWIFDAD